MACKETIEEIMLVVKAYFEGLYRADSAILKPLFHADARYVNTVAGDYMNYSVEKYLSIVDTRTSPAAKDKSRKGQIISIEFDGQCMGFVKLSMTMLGRQYLDYLTLIFVNNQWQIMSKVFSYKTDRGST